MVADAVHKAMDVEAMKKHLLLVGAIKDEDVRQRAVEHPQPFTLELEGDDDPVLMKKRKPPPSRLVRWDSTSRRKGG